MKTVQEILAEIDRLVEHKLIGGLLFSLAEANALNAIKSFILSEPDELAMLPIKKVSFEELKKIYPNLECEHGWYRTVESFTVNDTDQIHTWHCKKCGATK